ncbi:hypothetical protein BDZ91DRAFT_791322 [Kalaharituber pfeilii]|nr:hypothetical protein BDZ91DRAFT_791322 [Kalaharituber pfeilii]
MPPLSNNEQTQLRRSKRLQEKAETISAQSQILPTSRQQHISNSLFRPSSTVGQRTAPRGRPRKDLVNSSRLAPLPPAQERTTTAARNSGRQRKHMFGPARSLSLHTAAEVESRGSAEEAVRSTAAATSATEGPTNPAQAEPTTASRCGKRRARDLSPSRNDQENLTDGPHKKRRTRNTEVATERACVPLSTKVSKQKGKGKGKERALDPPAKTVGPSGANPPAGRDRGRLKRPGRIHRIASSECPSSSSIHSDPAIFVQRLLQLQTENHQRLVMEGLGIPNTTPAGLNAVIQKATTGESEQPVTSNSRQPVLKRAGTLENQTRHQEWQARQAARIQEEAADLGRPQQEVASHRQGKVQGGRKAEKARGKREEADRQIQASAYALLRAASGASSAVHRAKAQAPGPVPGPTNAPVPTAELSSSPGSEPVLVEAAAAEATQASSAVGVPSEGNSQSARVGFAVDSEFVGSSDASTSSRKEAAAGAQVSRSNVHAPHYGSSSAGPSRGDGAGTSVPLFPFEDYDDWEGSLTEVDPGEYLELEEEEPVQGLQEKAE